MAKTNENKSPSEAHETAQDAKRDSAQAASEPQYSAADLASAAMARFKVQPEVVTAALRMAGKQKAALTEAQRIIEEFMKREVK